MRTVACDSLDRPALLDRFRRVRARTRAMFDLLDPSLYYERPIAVRNPVVFYEGHLPAFSVNTLIKRALGEHGIDERLETMFARGIEPTSEATAIARGNLIWRSRDEVIAYASAADARIEAAIQTADLGRPGHPLLHRAQALCAILEHEEMHQETLAYMWHQVPYARKRKPAGYQTVTPRSAEAWSGVDGAIVAAGPAAASDRADGRGDIIGIPDGDTQVGTGDDTPFA